MATTTTTTTTSSGVKYTVTTNTLLGAITSWNVTITDPDGTTAYNGTLLPGALGILQTGYVASSTDSAISIANLLVGATYIVPAGVTGSVDILANLITIFPTTIYVGGTATISTLLSALSGLVVDVDGGTATLNNGLVANALSGTTVNITNGGTFSGGTSLITALSGTTIHFGTGGGTFILNAGASLLNLSSTSITGYDPSKDTIELENTVTTVSYYTITGSSTVKTITLYGVSGTEIASYSATLASGVTLTNNTYYINGSTTNPLKITYSDNNTYIGACFLPGSMIRTPSGDVPVEDVRIGDVVTTFDWRSNTEKTQNVRWVGCKSVTVSKDLRDDEAGYPVRVLKDAVSQGVPCKDMLVTAEHCLFFEGKFIPVRMLVNGKSIFYDMSITTYTYYHIETEPHAVIWSDGMLTETYLDTENRYLFRQHGEVSTIAGRARSWESDAAAPLTVERSAVEPIYRAIDARAAVVAENSPENEVSFESDPDVHLMTDRGQILRPLRRNGDHYSFMIPPGVSNVRIMSRKSRPSDSIGSFVDDRRELGVLVGNIMKSSADKVEIIDQHLTALSLDGWHGLEEGRGRWTTGAGSVSVASDSSCSPFFLAVEVMGAGPYRAPTSAVSIERRRA
ncbi:Hint domain-containing protein [Acetobacter sacchari]|uniref:Hint domain-containing protein n=1 Tax=Acetobacter sacchari TaxID=2661687 RepID=A0ABS3LUE1_9PROT|nr:Hint domain-containing protein [Acetobacter sacchari]MBO1359527.1 Hint domain-containing protein [Acetobacter sacchari]